MTDEEGVPQTKENTDGQIPEPDRGLLVLEQLKIMNKLLGAINQNITKFLTPIGHDLEVAKTHLGKLKKIGAQEVTIKDDRQPTPYVPPVPGDGK